MPAFKHSHACETRMRVRERICSLRLQSRRTLSLLYYNHYVEKSSSSSRCADIYERRFGSAYSAACELVMQSNNSRWIPSASPVTPIMILLAMYMGVYAETRAMVE